MGLNRNLSKVPEVLTVSGSNVGLGTPSPNAQLHVYGTAGWIKAETNSNNSARFQAKNSSQTTDYGTDANGGFIQTQGAYPLLIYINQTERMRITSGGQVNVGNNDSGALRFYNAAATYVGGLGTAYWAFGGSYSSSDLGMITPNTLIIGSGGSERMRITSGGNVGIGTNTPGQKFVVSSGGTYGFEVALDVSDRVVLQGYNRNTLAYVQMDYDALLHKFSAGGSERMRITSGGLLGVGTASSGGARLNILNIASQAFLALRSTNNVYEIATMNFDQNTDILSIVNNQGASSSGISFGTVGTERGRFTSGGSLLIGDTSQGFNPATQGYMLGVKSSVGQAFISIAKSGQTLDSGGMIVGLDASTGYVYLRENIALTFATNDTERMKLTAGGDLLIGASSTSGLARSATLDSSSNCGIVLKTSGTNKGYLYTSVNNVYLETTGGNVVARASTGGAYLSNGATSWASASDRRLKDINYKIENAVDKLCTLDAVSFSWKSDESRKEVLGLIAQDVEKVFPQIIDKSKLPKSIGDESEVDETEYLGVRYQELIPVLVKAIQELTERIKILENK